LYRLAQKIGPFSVWSTQKGWNIYRAKARNSEEVPQKLSQLWNVANFKDFTVLQAISPFISRTENGTKPPGCIGQRAQNIALRLTAGLQDRPYFIIIAAYRANSSNSCFLQFWTRKNVVGTLRNKTMNTCNSFLSKDLIYTWNHIPDDCYFLRGIPASVQKLRNALSWLGTP
jgi:hypothetical protein